jgi:hypothetical protein
MIRQILFRLLLVPTELHNLSIYEYILAKKRSKRSFAFSI